MAVFVVYICAILMHNLSENLSVYQHSVTYVIVISLKQLLY